MTSPIGRSPAGTCRASPMGSSSARELIHARGLGTLRIGEEALPTASSVFRIASMTKSFTAATVLSLRDEGLLRLDDPIADYVPELAKIRLPDLRLTADQHPPPAHDDRRLPDRRPVGRSPAGPRPRRVPGAPRGRPVVRVRAGHPVRVLEHRLRHPRPAHHERRGPGVPRGRPRADPSPARHGFDRLPRGGGAGRSHGHAATSGATARYLDEPSDGYGALASMGGIFTTVEDLATVGRRIPRRRAAARRPEWLAPAEPRHAAARCSSPWSPPGSA